MCFPIERRPNLQPRVRLAAAEQAAMVVLQAAIVQAIVLGLGLQLLSPPFRAPTLGLLHL